MIRLVVFDCDGTLVDSQHNIVAAMGTAFSRNDLAVPDARILRRTVGLSPSVAMAELHPRGSFAARTSLVEDYSQAFRALRGQPDHEEPLFPGAAEAIVALHEAGYLLGVATGKSQRGLRLTLERFDLTSHFVTLQTADDAPSKPHPGMVDNAMTEAGATAAETVVIGDTTFDMEMAVNAGAKAIGVAWGYHEVEELRDTGAQTIIDSFDALSGAIAAL
ncbi:MAG: HAD-IA family hydrolase [Alphaproteobacteria bacterium]